MGMTVRMDIGRFKELLRAEVDKLHAATRPAAQEGIQIIYDRARSIVAAELTSEKEHYFYGSAAKALPPGKKKAAAYGPYQPGNLQRAI